MLIIYYYYYFFSNFIATLGFLSNCFQLIYFNWTKRVDQLL